MNGHAGRKVENNQDIGYSTLGIGWFHGAKDIGRERGAWKDND